MNMCPKCGTLLNGNETKCPKCHTLLINDEIESLQEPIIENKNSKHKTSNKNNNKKSSNKEKAIKTLKIISIILLFLISILLILNIVYKIKYKDNNSTDNKEKQTNTEVKEEPTASEETTPITINDELINEEGNLFIFKNDGTFYMYEDKDNLEDNYYEGKYTYTQGHDALTDMSYTDEDFANNFGEDINMDNVYSISINLSKKVEDKQDTKDTTQWWFLLIIKDDQTAIGYNKTLDARYELTRK